MATFEINFERKPIHSTDAKESKSLKKKKPLTRNFFSQLIKLETEFYNKVYTVTTLDELIQFYARAVEYYDSAKDEISAYFIYKIQDVLATKKSLKMLLEQNVKCSDKRDSNTSASEQNEKNETMASTVEPTSAPNSRQFISENILEENSEEEDDQEENRQIELKRKQHQIKPMKKDRMSISTLKNKKQRFVNFFYKMQTQKINEKQNMHAVLDEFWMISERNDVFVKRDIDNQKYRIRQRIERKNQAFISYSRNPSSQFENEEHVSVQREKEVIFEHFLDDKDLDQFEDQGNEEESYTDTEPTSGTTSIKSESQQSKKRIEIQIPPKDGFGNSQIQQKDADKVPRLMTPRRNPGYFSPSSAYNVSSKLIASPMGTRRFKFGNE